MDYNFTASDLINQRERFRVASKLEPAIDEIVSKIVGKKIYQRDPRLIKLVIKWKGNKSENSMEQDNFFDDPKRIAELKSVLNGNI